MEEYDDKNVEVMFLHVTQGLAAIQTKLYVTDLESRRIRVEHGLGLFKKLGGYKIGEFFCDKNLTCS